MSTLESAAPLLAASPSPAAHAILLGAIAVIALGAFGVARRRRKRDAATVDAQLAEERRKAAELDDDLGFGG